MMKQDLRATLRRWLREGFWFPVFQGALDGLAANVSLGNHWKSWLRDPDDAKPPRGAAEVYQFVWLVGALCWTAGLSISAPLLASGPARAIGGIVALYRVLEIALFALHWVFVSTSPLHGTRRSLAQFVANLFEVAALSSIALTLWNCQVGTGSAWGSLYSHLASVFTLGVVPVSDSRPCQFVAHAELVTAALLLSVAVASVIGGLVRGEQTDQGGT